jgi:putative membrane protein
MKIGFVLALLAGALLAAGLIFYGGAGQVFGMLLALGWGLVPMLALHLVQILCCALGWRSLIPRDWPRSLGILIETRWIREGANGLLPVANIGGEIVGARVLSFHGVRGDIAGASVVVDLTVEVVTQLLFTILGVAFLFLGGQVGADVGVFVLGTAVAALAVIGFVVALRFGLVKRIEDLLERAGSRVKWLAFPGIKGMHEAIRAIHRQPRALGIAAFWHFLGWMLGGFEVWLALHFMGVEVGPRQALILESLGHAARAAGLAIPGGIGIQEGGFLLVGALVGLAPDASLALSLAKRLRELAFGLPALALWQWIEGRRLVGSRPKG